MGCAGSGKSSSAPLSKFTQDAEQVYYDFGPFIIIRTFSCGFIITFEYNENVIMSHNGGCVSRVRRINGAYRRIKTQKGPPPFGRGPLRAGSPTPKSTTIIPQKDFGNEIRFVTKRPSIKQTLLPQCFICFVAAAERRESIKGGITPRPSLTPTDRGPVQTSLTGGYGRNRPDVVRPRYPYRAGT